MNDPYQIINTVAMTEKSNELIEHNQYTFIIHRRANKYDVKFAVHKLFDRHVKSVNIINCKGKTKRNRYGVGKRADWKKAIVTLRDGEEAIDLF